MQIAIPRLPAVRLPKLEREHWIASSILSLVAGLYLFAGLSVSGVGVEEGRAIAGVPSNLPGVLRTNAPPAPEPLQFREVAPQTAVAINAAVPISDSPNPAASAFTMASASATDRARALQCLTAAIYYEAARETVEGQRAVAQVVLNRVRHPVYPNTVCGVVYQGSERATGCQFTFTCDGSLARAPMASYWERARQVAALALSGSVYAPVGWATHYHTNYVVPYWSSSLVKAATIGTHIFYRWTGGWGRAPAFKDRHAGFEPDYATLRQRALAAEIATDAAAAALAQAAAVNPDIAIDAATKDKLAAAAAAAAAKSGTGSASIDSFQRAVIRRYEPMQGAAVTAALESQAKKSAPDDKSVASHRWAMSGRTSASPGQSAAALAATDTAPVKKANDKPAAPACLEGVKKAGADGAVSC